MFPQKDPGKDIQIARLLALYSVLDNPLSNRRNGVHLGLDPELRAQCDYELFASPLNACVPNLHFASKWPHIEYRFGSIGSYPDVLSLLPVNSVVCVNPPFTEAYLADVMDRLAELKVRFRLRIAVPILEAPWRKKLQSALPSAQLLRSYYDASLEQNFDVLHPTLLWEDPRCTPRVSTHSPPLHLAPMGLNLSPMPTKHICAPLAHWEELHQQQQQHRQHLPPRTVLSALDGTSPVLTAMTAPVVEAPLAVPLPTPCHRSVRPLVRETSEPRVPPQGGGGGQTPPAEVTLQMTLPAVTNGNSRRPLVRSAVMTVSPPTAAAAPSPVGRETGAAPPAPPPPPKDRPEPLAETPRLDAEEWPVLQNLTRKPLKGRR